MNVCLEVPSWNICKNKKKTLNLVVALTEKPGGSPESPWCIVWKPWTPVNVSTPVCLVVVEIFESDLADRSPDCTASLAENCMSTHHHRITRGMYLRLMCCITERECQRVETSSGLAMTNCGWDEGIYIVSSALTLWSPQSLHLLCSCVVTSGTSVHSVTTIASCGVILASAVERLSGFQGWRISRNVFWVGTVDCCFRWWPRSRFEKRWNEALWNHTRAVWYTTGVDMLQTLTLSYFSEAETSAAALSNPGCCGGRRRFRQTGAVWVIFVVALFMSTSCSSF